MSKQQVIDAIKERNRSASTDYLVNFNQQALEDYLQRLTLIQGRRGRNSIWVRHTTERSVVTRLAS
jgi:hypothetical protein